MKYLLVLSCLLYYSASGQIPVNPNDIRQKAAIDIKGDSNIVVIMQGNANSITYNLNDKKQFAAFLQLLNTLPEIQRQLGKISSDQENLKVLIKKIYQQTSVDGVLIAKEFSRQLQTYMEENVRLRIEIEDLKKQSADTDFARVLKMANNKLEKYDNEGYQALLEEFKTAQKERVHQEQADLAKANYLQASNNFSNFNYRTALEQIRAALELAPDNVGYLLWKAKIDGELFLNKENIETCLKLLSLDGGDSLREKEYSFLGNAYNLKSDYDSALYYYDKSLALCERLNGVDDSTTGVIYNNIGIAYFGKGNYDEALKFLMKEMKIRERSRQDASRSLASVYSSIGAVYNERYLYDSAVFYLRKSISIDKQVSGGESPSIATSYSNIGFSFSHLKEFDSSLAYFNHSLRIFLRVYGEEHLNTASVYGNIGGVYSEMKKWDQALEYYRRSLAICGKLFGWDDVTLGNPYHNMAEDYSDREKYDSALKYQLKATAIFENKLGRDHINTATCYYSLGELFYKMADYGKSAEFLSKAAAVRAKAFGEKYPATVFAYYRVGTVFKENGQYDSALRYFEKIGPAGPDQKPSKMDSAAQRIYLTVGLLYFLKGEQSRGMAYLGDSSWTAYDKAAWINRNATTIFKRKRYTECISLYLLAQEFLDKSDSSGAGSLAAIISQNLAKSYCYNGEKDKAMPIFEKALRLARQTGKEGKELTDYIEKNYQECKMR